MIPTTLEPIVSDPIFDGVLPLNHSDEVNIASIFVATNGFSALIGLETFASGEPKRSDLFTDVKKVITLYKSSEDAGEIKELPVIEEDIEMNDKEDEEMIAAEEEPATTEKEPASTSDKSRLVVKEALAVIFPEGVKTSSRAHDIKRVERLFTLVFVNKVLVKWAGKECDIPESTARSYVKKAKMAVQHLIEEEPKKDTDAIKTLTLTKMKLVEQPRSSESERRPRNRKFLREHSQFLAAYFELNGWATLASAQQELLKEFPKLESVSVSGLHKHVKSNCSLSIIALKKKHEGSKCSIPNLNTDHIFVDCVDMMVFVRESFGWPSKKTLKKNCHIPSSAIHSSIYVPTFAAFTDSKVLNLSIVSPSAVLQDSRKKVATHAEKSALVEHFFKTLLENIAIVNGAPKVFVVADSFIYHNKAMKKLLASRGYEIKLLQGFSFEHFWWVFKLNIERHKLNDDDKLLGRFREAAKTLTSEDLKECIMQGAYE